MRTRLSIAILFLMVATFGETGSGLPFIKDDYAKALAEAKQRNVPIFVECWAPW